MAALSVANPTLLDLAKATDPDGKIADIVEILNATNEVLLDMSWKEGNLVTGNRTTIRSGIPAPTWRKLYGGVQPNKSTNVQVTDNTGMLEAYAEVDKALADLNGNTAAFRLSEDRPHIEGMNQEIVDTLFYGNEGTEPEAFTGFSPRFNSSTASNGENIIKAGSSDTDNASIWLIGWGDNTVHGIVPKGSKAGLQHTDLGEVTVEDASNGSNTGRYQAYRSHYRWDAGLTVKDWRYVVRCCNIERSALTKDAATGPDLSDLMYQMLERVPSLSGARFSFYMDRKLREFLRRQSSNLLKNSTLTVERLGGTMLMEFHGIPVRRVDALSANEALVV